MSKDDQSWFPGRRRPRFHRVVGAAVAIGARGDREGRRAARHPDREPRRGARPVGARRRPAADRRGRHRLRLLDAVAGARPAVRWDDRHDRSRPRAHRSRPRLVARGGHPRRAHHGRQRPGTRGVRERIRPSPARSTWSSSTPSSPSTAPTSRPLTGRLAPGALVAADNVLWSGRVSGASPADPDDANTNALRAFDAAVVADPRFNATILPVGDGLLIASWRG